MIQAREAQNLYLDAMRTPEQEEAPDLLDRDIRLAASEGKSGITLMRGLTDVEVYELTRVGYEVTETPTKAEIFWGNKNDVPAAKAGIPGGQRR